MLTAYVRLSTAIVPVSPSSARLCAAVAPKIWTIVKVVFSRKVAHSALKFRVQHFCRHERGMSSARCQYNVLSCRDRAPCRRPDRLIRLIRLYTLPLVL